MLIFSTEFLFSKAIQQNMCLITNTGFFEFQGTYNLARAQQSFRSLVHIHEKNGKLVLLSKYRLDGQFLLVFNPNWHEL